MTRSCALSLMVMLCAVALAQTPQVQQGLELLRQERYAEALVEFEAAQRAQPASAAVENALGITLTRLNRMDEANDHYRRAIRLNAKLASPYKNLGLNYLNAKLFEAAEKPLKTALALEPGDPFVHYYLALLYLGTGREKEAAEQLVPARASIENDADSAFSMIKALLHLNQTARAVNLIEAVERRGAFPPGREFELAKLLRESQLYATVVERLRRIVNASPGDWTNRYNLAIALIEAKQGREAVTVLESLAIMRPADANVWGLLGAACETSGDMPKALDAYQKAARADPDNPDRYLDYTRLLIDLDRYDESVEFVRAGLSHVQDAYALNIRLGSTLMMKGDYAAARDAFSDAIVGHPEIALGYVAKAQAYLRERMEEAAANELARARAAVGPDYMVEYYYGLALTRLDRGAEAVAALERAIALDAGAPEAHYELGKVLLTLNQMEAARVEFERVVTLDPRHANAHYQLSRVYTRLGDSRKASEHAALTKQLKQAQREAGLAAQRQRLSRFQLVAVHP